MIDTSNSMIQKMDSAKDALINYLKQSILEKSQIAFVSFGDIIIASHLEMNGADLYSKILKMSVDGATTEMYQAFEAVSDILKERASKEKGNIGIILVTDGFPSTYKGGEKAILKFVKDDTIPNLILNGKFRFECIRMGNKINNKFLDELEKLFEY